MNGFLRVLGAVVLTIAAAQDGSAQQADSLYRGKTARQWIEQLRTETTPEARTEAAYALSGVVAAAPQSVPVLTAALEDESPNVRWAAAFALGELGLPAVDAVPALTKLGDADTGDENESIRWVAGRSARRIQRAGSATP